MGAMLAIGGTGIFFLAGLNLLTCLCREFSRWRNERLFQTLARKGRPLHRRPFTVEPALSPLPGITVDHAVAAYYALHHLVRVVSLEDDARAGVEPLTPDVLRSLLGSPGDGTVARFDAQGGFSDR